MAITPKNTGLSLRQLAEREERVFPTYPQVGRYFPAATIEDARTRLGRAIERGDGPGLIIGGPGTGKSLLLQVIASQYHEQFDVVLPACARLCTRRALLQSILFELGLPYRVRDEGDLRLSLLDHLLSREECPDGLLLLVDEAQTLSAGLLDELRVLTNLVRGGMPRVRLVLAGSSALEESFAHPDQESFSQRLAARCYLGPFGQEETAQFVRAQVAASGATPDDIFEGDAFRAIFEATDGVPRLVNQLCDRAMTEGCAAGRMRIDRQIIQAAWADIQQLPAPWETPAPTTAPPAPLQVVEFGSLAAESENGRPAVGDVLVVNSSGDEIEFDVEPTEIDCEVDEALTVGTTRGDRFSSKNGVEDDPARNNPFDEEFDEEEVVLDNFASWDEMFHRDTPRVQNLRDPEFSALVQSAISTADVGALFKAPSPYPLPEGEGLNVATSAAFRMHEADVDDFEIATMDLSARNTAQDDEMDGWPPLRLAIMPESTATPLVDEVEEADAAESWLRSDAPHWNDAAPPAEIMDEEPVLIVEDDNPTPSPPVRREEYRNLFSRLRSG